MSGDRRWDYAAVTASKIYPTEQDKVRNEWPVAKGSYFGWGQNWGSKMQAEEVWVWKTLGWFSLQWSKAAASHDSAVKAEFWTSACCIWKMQEMLPKMLAQCRTGLLWSAGIKQMAHELHWVKRGSQCPMAANGFTSGDPSNAVLSLQALICVAGWCWQNRCNAQARDEHSLVY